MRRPVRALHMLPVLFVFASAVAAAPIKDANTPPPSLVAQELGKLVNSPVDESLLSVQTLGLRTISARAAVAYVAGRAFPERAVLLQSRGAWRVIWHDGKIVGPSARYPVLHLELGTESDADGIATDLVALFADPDPSYALVLHSREDVPVKRENSDFLRDLRRRGLDGTALNDALLHNLRTEVLGPRLLREKEGVRLLFTSWSFFGGDVEAWEAKVVRGTVRVVGRTRVAAEVGSYDLFP